MPDSFLSQDEVDELLKGINGEEDEVVEAPDPSAIREYNLATQERIVRGRMATLELINERFANLLGVELFNLLRRSADISVGPVRICKYTEFVRSMVVPANYNLVQMKPLRGKNLMVFDPGFVFLVVDNLFGGDGRFHTRIEGRDFTPTEQRIIQKLLDIVFETCTKAWEPVYPIQFEYLRSEMNTQFANIATPNEVVISTTFAIEIGHASGNFHFCFPYSTIEPIRDLLTSPLQGEMLGTDKRWVTLMTQQIQDAEVEIIAKIGNTSISLKDVLKMKIGDVIPMEINEEIAATIENIPVFLCRCGISKGQYALSIKKLLKSDSTEYVKGELNAN